MFRQHILTDALNKGSDFSRIRQSAALQGAKYSEESLLTDIFINVARPPDSAQLEPQQLTEESNKVALDLWIAFNEALDVVAAEGCGLDRRHEIPLNAPGPRVTCCWAHIPSSAD